jgi:hypothetical protein
MAQVRMKLLVGALALVAAFGAQGQQKQLYVAGYGGTFEQTMPTTPTACTRWSSSRA